MAWWTNKRLILRMQPEMFTPRVLLPLLLLPTRAYPLHRPNASSPIKFPREYEPVSWGGTVVKDAKTGKYHGFFDTGCYTADSVMVRPRPPTVSAALALALSFCLCLTHASAPLHAARDGVSAAACCR